MLKVEEILISWPFSAKQIDIASMCFSFDILITCAVPGNTSNFLVCVDRFVQEKALVHLNMLIYQSKCTNLITIHK